MRTRRCDRPPRAGISQFGAACGKTKFVSDVPVGKFVEGTALVDLIGQKAVETLDELAAKKGSISMTSLNAKLDLILSKLK